jgi:desulfoferrodoxin (superoxide reductase-like protein)
MNATEPEFSSVVCITIDIPLSNEINIICTGTLISLEHILTSAHCFNNAELTSINVILGSVHLAMTTKYYIMWWITYMQWATEMRRFLQFSSNDIAVIRVNFDWNK